MDKAYQVSVSTDIDQLIAAPLFFNHSDYLTKQPIEAPLVFTLLRGEDIVSQVYFSLSNEVAKSPYRSPFGGIMNYTLLDKALLYFFWEEIKKGLSKNGIEQVKMTMPPVAYLNADDHTAISILKEEAKECIVEDNYHVYVNEGTFEAQLSETQAKKLRRLKRDEFVSQKLHHKNIAYCYDLLVTCFRRKVYPVTMTEEELQGAFSQHPLNYELFGCFKEGELVATAFTVKVTDTIVYLMYNADHPSYHKESPLVVLYDYMYNHFRREGVQLIDLGISSVNGISNSGLETFKKRMGGVRTDKCSYLFLI